MRKLVVCGVKLLAPTIEMLVPPAYTAVMKSRGVSPLIDRTDVPSFGWIISPAASVSPRAQTTTKVTRIAGPQNERMQPRKRTNGFEIVLKNHHTRLATRGLRMPVPARA